ncbi:DUF3368 domain-containing protein [Aphanizomenon sp. PH219]|nr:DUF3368 domain-containing protein [Aphanizomenon sp. 202]MDK2459962.1 DUF3368 domain-containing protein [Aphanizomenon sp. PH219]
MLASVKDVLNEMQAQGMRISDRLYVQVLTMVYSLTPHATRVLPLAYNKVLTYLQIPR